MNSNNRTPATAGGDSSTTPGRSAGALAGLLAHYPLAQKALLFFPVLAVAGPFASLRPGAPGFPYFYRVLWALLLVITVPLFVVEARRRTLPLAFSVMVAVFAIWAPVTLAWTPAPQVGRTEILAGLSATLGAWVLLVLTRGRSRSLRYLRWGWMATFAVTMLVVTWEFFTGDHLGPRFGVMDWIYSAYSVAGLDTNPNGLSNFLVAASGVMCGLVIREVAASRTARRPRWRLPLLFAGLVLASYVIYLTGSRSGTWSLMFLLLMAALWCLPRRRLLAVPLALICLALVLPVLQRSELNLLRPPVISERAAQPPQSGHFQDGVDDADRAADVASADRLRRELTMIGVRAVGQRPLQGHGAGAALTLVERDPDYEPGVPAAQRRVLNLHNTFLEIGVNYGLVGLLPVLAVPLLTLATLLRPRRLRRHWRDPRVYEGLAMLLALFVSSIITSSSIGTPTFWLLAAYAAAIAWNYEDCTRRVEAGAVPAPRDADPLDANSAAAPFQESDPA